MDLWEKLADLAGAQQCSRKNRRVHRCKCDECVVLLLMASTSEVLRLESDNGTVKERCPE